MHWMRSLEQLEAIAFSSHHFSKTSNHMAVRSEVSAWEFCFELGNNLIELTNNRLKLRWPFSHFTLPQQP